MSLTVRILPTDEPTFEVAIHHDLAGELSVELTRDELEEFRDELHRVAFISQWECAHPPCRNHATSADGYCWEEHP